MMPLSLKAGSCIFLEKPDKESISHLWLLVTEPSGNPPEVVMVNLTTYREGVDTTVLLTDRDHSYIIHPTVVYYADARKTEVNFLYRLIALDPKRLHEESCSTELLKKVRNGLFKSEFTPRKIKKYCKEQLED